MTIIPIGIENADFGLERSDQKSTALDPLSIIGNKVYDTSKVIIWNLTNSREVGKNGNTELMIAIGRNDLLRARELILDGANPYIKNDKDLDALDILSRQDTTFTKDKIKLCALLMIKKKMKQRVKGYLSDRLLPYDKTTYDLIIKKTKKIRERNRVLNQPLPLMIAHAVQYPAPLAKKRQLVFYKNLREIFTDIAKIPELTPLLKITGYAIHNFFSKSRKELTLISDPGREEVETRDQRPVYGYYSRTRNTIEVGTPSGINAKSTWIHEMTHFVAETVFENSSDPYFLTPYSYFFQNETVKSLLFDLRRMKDKSFLPLGLSSLFNLSTYTQSERPAELIARISEMFLCSFMRVEVSSDIPTDEEVENSKKVIVYNNHKQMSEDKELYYAYKDSEDSPICRGHVIIDEPELDYLKNEPLEKTSINNAEMNYFLLRLDDQEINVASDEFIDEMQNRLIDYYKTNFLPECEKYVKAFRLKKCLFR